MFVSDCDNDEERYTEDSDGDKEEESCCAKDGERTGRRGLIFGEERERGFCVITELDWLEVGVSATVFVFPWGTLFWVLIEELLISERLGEELCEELDVWVKDRDEEADPKVEGEVLILPEEENCEVEFFSIMGWRFVVFIGVAGCCIGSRLRTDTGLAEFAGDWAAPCAARLRKSTSPGGGEEGRCCILVWDCWGNCLDPVVVEEEGEEDSIEDGCTLTTEETNACSIIFDAIICSSVKVRRFRDEELNGGLLCWLIEGQYNKEFWVFLMEFCFKLFGVMLNCVSSDICFWNRLDNALCLWESETAEESYSSEWNNDEMLSNPVWIIDWLSSNAVRLASKSRKSFWVRFENCNAVLRECARKNGCFSVWGWRLYPMKPSSKERERIESILEHWKIYKGFPFLMFLEITPNYDDLIEEEFVVAAQIDKKKANSFIMFV